MIPRNVFIDISLLSMFNLRKALGWNFPYVAYGYTWGSDITKTFLENNGLTKLIRGRTLCMEVGILRFYISKEKYI
jgi:hypothetical protein